MPNVHGNAAQYASQVQQISLTITPAAAEKLSTRLETILDDCHCPFEVTPRIDRTSGRFIGLTLSAMLPDFHTPAGATMATTAGDVAQRLGQLAVFLTRAHQDIYKRFPAA